jgi:hypothetical protein
MECMVNSLVGQVRITCPGRASSPGNDGEGEAKGRTFPNLGLVPEASPVLLDHALRDIEAEAKTVRVLASGLGAVLLLE